jgi:arylsulfatase A-like enzyme
MDILPTFLDIANMNEMEAGLKTQESPPVRGRSFWKQLQGEDTPVHDKSESIPWMTSETKQALVRWPWKIIQIQSDDDDANALTEDRNKWLLFNLVDDPGETINLANQYSKIQSELIAQWLKL